MNLAQIHTDSLASFDSIIKQVTPDQWKNSTPCSEWDVEALMNHMVNENLWVPPIMEGKSIADVGDSLDGDLLKGDPQGAYANSAKLAGEAVPNEGALNKTVHLSYGDLPASIYIGHRVVDLVVHGWDLAQGTELQAEPNVAYWQAVWEIIEPELDGLQGSGSFGSPQEGADSKDVQARVLANLGRKPV